MKSIKKKVFSKILMSFLLIFLANSGLFAQKSYNLDSGSDFKISGTSSLHDWTMSGKGGNGSANITVEGSKVTAISSISVQINPEILKSGKDGMDKNAYKALKTSTHKTAKFVLKSVKKVNDTTWTLTGDFTIAGTTKSQTFNVTASVSGAKVTLKGSDSFKLTDYGIKPPTAMLGTIKTGDPVTISFTASFK